MAATAITVKKRFINKETGDAVEPGQPLKVSADRAKRLTELGFAVYSDEPEAAQIKEAVKVAEASKPADKKK